MDLVSRLIRSANFQNFDDRFGQDDTSGGPLSPTLDDFASRFGRWTPPGPAPPAASGGRANTLPTQQSHLEGELEPYRRSPAPRQQTPTAQQPATAPARRSEGAQGRDPGRDFFDTLLSRALGRGGGLAPGLLQLALNRYRMPFGGGFRGGRSFGGGRGFGGARGGRHGGFAFGGGFHPGMYPGMRGRFAPAGFYPGAGDEGAYDGDDQAGYRFDPYTGQPLTRDQIQTPSETTADQSTTTPTTPRGFAPSDAELTPGAQTGTRTTPPAGIAPTTPAGYAPTDTELTRGAQTGGQTTGQTFGAQPAGGRGQPDPNDPSTWRIDPLTGTPMNPAWRMSTQPGQPAARPSVISISRPDQRGLVSLGLPNGSQVRVAADVAPIFRGFLSDLVEAGAPLHEVGGYNPRLIAGTFTPSQHAFGHAIDINQRGRDVVSPDFRRWANENRQLLHDLSRKWGLVSGGDWRRPDFGHWEWRGDRAA